MYGNPSYWNGNLYLAPANSDLRQYSLSGAKISTTPVSRSTTRFSVRGANTVVSANGNSSGIVWAYSRNGAKLLELHAYDATNVSRELWNNKMNAPRDSAGGGVQFGVPIIANGKVIVAGQHEITIYGLLK